MKVKCLMRLCAAIFIGLALLPGMSVAGDEALFVHQYFDLLRSGQLSRVLLLLDEPLFSQRQPLLRDNPAYASFIVTRYRNLQVEIVHVEPLDGNHSAVDLDLYLDTDAPPLRTRFVLRRYQESWKLLSESIGG